MKILDENRGFFLCGSFLRINGLALVGFFNIYKLYTSSNGIVFLLKNQL